VFVRVLPWLVRRDPCSSVAYSEGPCLSVAHFARRNISGIFQGLAAIPPLQQNSKVVIELTVGKRNALRLP
jgi:hypothetical protein